ncbi:tetratricopeptide repeat protein [Peribacillus cavernae]|uniref:Tetratricopeptide repeat protein n=1 Tax=Peribacillus cavernae TaxID=1674310 RepID=A0A433HLQ0_9BACI|nr:tetratricopeptide repeat protein [Peribacillus cavernae]MDQ0218980.1 tetratricopeptide (TPR) repeat protein [Peribacillus cavernae]RUQ29314.1 tetratricopeptide repeat protein [Peribacillus cavernae]
MNIVEKTLQLLKKGEFEEAGIQIARIKASESAEDMLLLADEMLQLGFIEEAKDLYEQLLRLFPEEGELMLSLAEILIDGDQEDEALVLLARISPEDEIYPSALLLEADLYQMQGMDEVSEQKLLKASKLLPEERLIDFALGELYYQQGRDQDALASYMKVLATETEIGGANLNQRVAEALGGLGRFEEALPYFEKALDARLEINTLFEYGLTAYQAGLYETAVEKFTELKGLDPEYNSLYLYLARAYEHLEDIDRSLGTVQEGIRVDEFNKDLYFYGGKIALKKGEPREAERMFREALAIDPGYLEAALTLLKLLMQEERYQDTLECIEEVKKYGEEDPQFDWFSAVSHQKLEQYEVALNDYHNAYNSFKNNHDFLEDYGFFLIEEGDRPTAREIFSKLAAENPSNDEYVLILERLAE